MSNKNKKLGLGIAAVAAAGAGLVYAAQKTSQQKVKKIAKAAGRLTYAFVNASVPKVTVVVGEAYGTAYLTMNSKSIGADIVYVANGVAIVAVSYVVVVGKAFFDILLVEHTNAIS